MMTSPRQTFELKGVHVLVMILGFFGVTIGMNVLFATLAIESFPGEDRQSPYQQGLHYNQTLEARRAQEALGWRAATALSPADGGATLALVFKDSQGQPLKGLKIEGALRRPTDGKRDVALQFVAGPDGLYRAPISHLDKGLWDLRASASDGAHTFLIDERLQWSPSAQH